MRIAVGIMALLFFVSQAMAQDERELLKHLSAASTDSARFFILRDLGYLHEFSDSAQAMKYYRQEMAIAKRLGQPLLLSMAYLDFGSVQYNAAAYDTALRWYRKSKREAERGKLTDRQGTACVNIANAYHQLYLSDSAAFFASQAVNHFRAVGDSMRLSLAYANLSAYFEDLNQFDLALKYVEESRRISGSIDDLRGEAGACANGAAISRKLGDSEKLDSYLNRLKMLAPNVGDRALSCKLYQNISGIYMDNGVYREGLRYADSALYYLSGQAHSEMAPSIWMNKGIGLVKTGKPAEGVEYLKRALQLAMTMRDWMVAREIHMELADYHADNADFKNAFFHQQEYTRFKDSTFQESALRTAAEIGARFRSEKQQAELDKLSKENELNSLKISAEKKWRWVILSVSAMALIILLLIVLAQRRKAQLAEEQERAQQEQIRRLESEKQVAVLDSMLKGEENERSRVAKDLHDGVGSLLSGVKLSLASMKGTMIIHEKQVQIFERSLAQLDHAINEMRRVAHNMMPETLVSSGLIAATDFFIRTLSESTTIAIHFEHHHFDERLPADHEIVVYRIIQELLNNAIKHSGADQIIVQLNKHEYTVNLVVEDNGKGFDPELWQHSRGMGFSNLKNRVNYLKGNIQVHTEPGQGTSYLVEFVIP
jgi:signal transduction histidine kinase